MFDLVLLILLIIDRYFVNLELPNLFVINEICLISGCIEIAKSVIINLKFDCKQKYKCRKIK